MQPPKARGPLPRKKKATFELSAGGVVFRRIDGEPRFLLVRDSYGRWALPKGHVEEGESTSQAAIREVSEEVGLDNLLVRDRLAPIRYLFRLHGKLIFKVVALFLIEATGDATLSPQYPEVRDARWLSAEEALKMIGYKNTRAVLREAIEKVRVAPR